MTKSDKYVQSEVKLTKQREIFEKAVEYFWNDFDEDGHFSFYTLRDKIELFMRQNPHRVKSTGRHATLSGLAVAMLRMDAFDGYELNNHGLFLSSVWSAGRKTGIRECEVELTNKEVGDDRTTIH